LERKNGKRKNPNVHVLQYFGLYNKYHLLDYQEYGRLKSKVILFKNEKAFRDLGSDFAKLR